MFVISAALVVAGPASAEPRFAARMGAPCSMCHVNPTGGGMRNAFGRSVFEPHQLTSGLGADLARFDPQVSEVFSFGADFRLAYIGQPTRDDRAAPPPSGLPGLFVKTPTKHTFFPMQADLYLTAELGDHVTFSSDVGANGSFEVIALAHRLPAGLYAKAGFFTPPYGTKIPNHTAAIRAPIGFDPRGKDAGVEFGIVRNWLDAQVAFQNGNLSGAPIDLESGKALSGRMALVSNNSFLKFHVGGSFLRISTLTPLGDQPEDPVAVSTETRFGPFLWLSRGRFTYIGEVVFRRVADGTTPDPNGQPTRSGQFVSYQEFNVLIRRGLNTYLSYEFMDRDTRTFSDPADTVHRVSASVNWFPVPYVEANVIYRVYLARADREEAGQHEVVAFLHLFF